MMRIQCAYQKPRGEKPQRCGGASAIMQLPSLRTVYTVGLYVNHASAKPLLHKHKGSNEQAFIKNQQAYNGRCTPSCTVI